MFPVKHTVIYTFFAITSVQNTCFILLCTMFFSFLAVFPLPESYQNDPKFHFNTLLRSDTQKSSKNVENTTVFWSRCETVFGPPPAKADIATAILTNVIEHLVLLLPPNKHAFTAKAVWADFGKQHQPTTIFHALRQTLSMYSKGVEAWVSVNPLSCGKPNSHLARKWMV